MPPVAAFLDFLYVQFYGVGPGSSGVAYRTLGVIRSAVSSVAFINGEPAGQHRLVVQFMKAAFRARPALPRYSSTWDPDMVLDYLSRLGDNATLPIVVLSRKLTCLLLLLSGQRFQTIEKFDIRNMTFTNGGVSFRIGDLLKTSSARFHLSEVSYLEYPVDRTLCVVTALRVYLDRTSASRLGGSLSRLLITSRPPFRAVSRSTLMRWTRDLLGAAGVDLTTFRPYSVKAAGVSSAASSLSLHTLMSSVGWRRESTFRGFYHMPVSQFGVFGAAVLANRP